MKKYDAVLAGYTCVDLTPEFKKNVKIEKISELFVPGKLIEIGGLDFVLGGAVPNTGLAMKKFGRKVYLNGLVGEDVVGKLAKDWLENVGAADGIETTREEGTAFSIVLAPPGVDRIFLESPGCNRIFDAGYINFEAVAASRLFHFGYPPLLRQFYINEGQQLSMLFSKVDEMGVLTSLDFSLPDPDSESGKIDWPWILQKTLPFVDIFLPSLEEAVQIVMPDKYDEIRSRTGAEDIIDLIPVGLIREAGKKIISWGVKVLLIKAGARGAYLLTDDISPLCKKSGLNLKATDWNFRELWCKAYHADESAIINASGAGDAANAAFLSAILDDESPGIALQFATFAGRNKLYCRDNYRDLADWPTMKNEIIKEPVEITAF
jgi:sugar/nucleoside kinase (ribokinase family)